MYSPEHKLAIDVDEKRHKDRDWYEDIERQKSIEKELDCEFIRINPYETDLDMDAENSKILTKKFLIDKISKRLLELEFNSKYLKQVVKKYCHHYKTCKLIV